MSTTGSSHHEDVTCPDPSVHSEFSRNSDLQKSASKAALLASEHKRTDSQSKQEINALGPDGKLSEAGAATSLKYAKATDLPSFPVVGIDTASGNKAANLANSNHKSFEWWKPGEASSNASKAAMLANSHGGNFGDTLWQYKPDGTGNSAAHLAMGKNSSPQLDYGYTDEGRKRALQAATLSVKKKPEPTNEAAPVESYPDSGNASYNALNAATSVAGNKRVSGESRMSATEASRYTHAKGLSRDMFGERPVTEAAQEETRHNAALRASAVVMAKQLYDIEKPHMDAIGAGDSAARKAHDQQYGAGRPEPSSDPLKAQAMNYLKVQEAAQRLASERLAKLDPDGVLAYREHYGYGPSSQASEAKASSRSRGRRSRATSQPEEDSSEDEAQAARIRNRTRGLNDQVASVDEQKRVQDRANLLAAAQRSVQARMHDMDEKVFAETGKVPPAMMAEWEAKARAKAEENSGQRMVTHGKVHIGGGKYMDQSEVDAIALARVQPTLDDISVSAEQQRIREAQIKADQERRAEELRLEKERQANMKAQTKMLDHDEKVRKQAEKDAEKAEKRRIKEEEKERAREEKEQAKRDKEAMKLHAAEGKAERKHTATEPVVAEPVVAEPIVTEPVVTEPVVTEPMVTEPVVTEPMVTEPVVAESDLAEPVAVEPESSAAAVADVDRRSEDVSPGFETNPVAATSPTSGTKKGFFSRMGWKKSGTKRISKGADDLPSATTNDTSGTGTVAVAPTATLDADAYKSINGESAELKARTKGKGRAESISPISSDEEPTRNAENWAEARDTFDDNDLGAPAARDIGETSARNSTSKFQEEL